MKLIDKDAIVAEIERLRDEKGAFYASDVLYNLEDFIDTLEVKEAQEEPVSEDLEEAASSYAKEEYNHKSPATLPDRCRGCYAPLMYAFKAGAEWQKAKDQEIIELAEDHAMLAGMEKMKEQMMAKAVDGEVTYGKSLAIPSLGYRLDKEGLDFGDKVKVIILKDE